MSEHEGNAEFQAGMVVTWTEEAVTKSVNDHMDAALVREGEQLTVVDVRDGQVYAKRPNGHVIPCNPKALRLV